MKQIPLKVIPVSTPDGKESTLDYREWLHTLMKAPKDPKAGMDIEEIRKSIRVLDALEKAKKANDGVLLLEDTDYLFMVEKVRAAKFMYASREIIQFVDDVTNGQPLP